jgi:hypothetical protein
MVLRTGSLLFVAILSAYFASRIFAGAHAQQSVPPATLLGSPVEFTVLEVCWFQNYFDLDPGLGAED